MKLVRRLMIVRFFLQINVVFFRTPKLHWVNITLRLHKLCFCQLHLYLLTRLVSNYRGSVFSGRLFSIAFGEHRLQFNLLWWLSNVPDTVTTSFFLNPSFFLHSLGFFKIFHNLSICLEKFFIIFKYWIFSIPKFTVFVFRGVFLAVFFIQFYTVSICRG